MANAESLPRAYPASMVNVTNKCTLRCKHCFVFRDGNPNEPKAEMDAETMVAKLAELQQRHQIGTMIWMGGEPMLRPDVLREGVKLFANNHVTTNGTIDLIELPQTKYVISLDGPPEVSDAIRGEGAFARVMKMLERVPPPDEFGPTVMSQCVVTKTNEDRLEELAQLLMPTRIEGLTFSFYVPHANDDTGLSWGSLKARDPAVRETLRLKEKYPDFIWNNRRTLELTLAANAKAVTDNCPVKNLMLPLYLEGDDFVNPFCCYGNDVDCDLCGAWAVFYIAAKMEAGDSA